MSEDKKLERFLITVTTNWYVTTIEDFDRDIKYYVDAVGLKLDNIERSYYLNQFGQIMCTPNEKDHLTYKVNTFHFTDQEIKS